MSGRHKVMHRRRQQQSLIKAPIAEGCAHASLESDSPSSRQQNQLFPRQAPSPATQVIDLKGKAVVPGLTDGHAHMDREALRNIFPSLGRVRSIRDIQERIAEL